MKNALDGTFQEFCANLLSLEMISIEKVKANEDLIEQAVEILKKQVILKDFFKLQRLKK